MIRPKVIIIGFNEVDALKKCVPSLLESGVPKEDIYFFDGPFPEFPHEYDYSTDGTLDYLKEQGITVVPCGEMAHMEKQNYRFKYFEKEDQQTALFYIDCDETIKGDWDIFCDILTKIQEEYHLQVFATPFCDIDKYYNNRSFRARVFLDPYNWEVKDRHWFFHYKRKKIDMGRAYVIGGLQIFHNSSCRPGWREEQMKDFQKVYTPKEEAEHLKSAGMDLPPDKVQCYPCGCTMGYVFFYQKRNGKMEKRGRGIDLRCNEHRPGGEKYQRLCPHCRFHTKLKCARCNYVAGEI